MVKKDAFNISISANHMWHNDYVKKRVRDMSANQPKISVRTSGLLAEIWSRDLLFTGVSLPPDRDEELC
jgi:hypothetical protein